ncbi:unnamed protein product, partial [Rotaria sp. Silwood1]
MACASPPKHCATCETLSAEQKQKPGILLCVGCQKHFCSEHIIQHRQYLSDLFENEVVYNRNALTKKVLALGNQEWPINIKTQLETINIWEQDTIELIKQSAACARKQLEEMALKESNKLKKQFSLLSDDLNKLRESENYFENDIDQLKNKFQRLAYDIEHFPFEISINEIPNELILVKSIIQSAPYFPTSYCFIDQILASQKPKVSIDLSTIRPGQMHPFGDQSIAFFSNSELPILDI